MALGSEDFGVNRDAWDEYLSSQERADEYKWADENEQRLWYCEHGKAYGIRCKRCEESDD